MARPSPSGERRGSRVRPAATRGFAYVLLLITLAVVGVGALWSVRLGSAWEQHRAEDELLRVGHEYRRALEAYRAAGRGEGPKDLKELLLDPRVPHKRRFLRKLYADPVTGTDDWVLVRDADGRILGLHSRSSREPVASLQIATPRGLTPALSYSEWVFGPPPDWFAQHRAADPPRP